MMMNNFFDLPNSEQRYLLNNGIDQDLIEAFNEHPQEDFDFSDIEEVLATFDGNRDGGKWRWILRLTPEAAYRTGGRFVYILGIKYNESWAKKAIVFSQFERKSLDAVKHESDSYAYNVLFKQLIANQRMNNQSFNLK